MTIKHQTKIKIAFAFLTIIALIGASCNAPQPSQPPKILQVDQTVQNGEIGITVKEVHFYEEKTAVLYQITSPENVYYEAYSRSDPTIECGNQIIETIHEQNQLVSTTGPDGVVNFLWYPALPEGTSDFIINFPPFSTNTGPAANFSVYLGDQVGTTLPPPEGRELQMDQLIEVSSVQFRLTSFILRPDSFEFTYKPEPGSETAGLLLAGPGPRFETISATDDSGHSYRAGMGGGTYLDFVEGHPQLKSQTIEFDSALQPGTTRLDVRIAAIGVFGTEPFRFQIKIAP